MNLKMITINKQTFERVLSSATNADNQVFDKIQAHLVATEESVKNGLLGSFAKEMDTVPNLQAVITRLICFRTYYEQIPQLDLVLTPTGFGIVSNQNLAPASADRVKNLREQVRVAYEDEYDKALELLVGTPWAETPQAHVNITNLIYTAKQYRLYTDTSEAHRTEMGRAHTLIYSAEEKIRERVSAEFFDYLLERTRHNEMTRLETTIIDMMCRFIGFCVTKNWGPAKSLLVRIEDFAEKHSAEFKVYMESTAYQVKHFEYYKNEKEDSAFFFG